MKPEIIEIVKRQATPLNIEVAAGLSFIETETGGIGFDTKTGKIIIQFEPVWFKRKAPYAPSGVWSLNGVERQQAEWTAFNDAFRKNPDAAMQATSIGLGQIMGFNYERLGYKTVGEMWDDAKRGLDRQVWQMFKYISTDNVLLTAIRLKQWFTVAACYNGAHFKELALQLGRTPYDETMAANYLMFKKMGL